MMRAVASGQVAVLTKPRTARGCAAHSQLDRHCSGRAARAKAAIEVPPGCSRCGVQIRRHAREPARDRQATVALPREWPLVAGRQCPRATRWLPSAAPNYSAAVSRPEPLRPATRNLVGGTLVAVALRGRPAREPRGAGRSAAGARSVSRPVRCRPGARIGEQPSPCGLPQLAVPGFRARCRLDIGPRRDAVTLRRGAGAGGRSPPGARLPARVPEARLKPAGSRRMLHADGGPWRSKRGAGLSLLPP